MKEKNDELNPKAKSDILKVKDNKQAPKGPKKERNYKIEGKIDVSKPLKEIIDKVIPNFKNPNKEEVFINNQILIDYITKEKYKGHEINLGNFENIKSFKDAKGIKELLKFYEENKCNVYTDKTIPLEIYYQLQNYYFNGNAMKKKIRIYLDIDNSLLKDDEKVRKIIDKIVNMISKITNIPKEELYVTNVRKNCLFCEIYRFVRKIVRNVVQFFIGDINQSALEEEHNRNALAEFFRSIYSELAVENADPQRVLEIHNVIENYIINPDETLDSRFDKSIDEFGRRSFLFISWHKELEIKNGKPYYYPTQEWEGFGLRVPYKHINGEAYYPEKIFKEDGEWCICYSDLSFSQLSYKIANIRRNVYDIYQNNKYLRYSLLFQCRIKKDKIAEENDDNITLSDNGYIVPYRLLKENIDLKLLNN